MKKNGVKIAGAMLSLLIAFSSTSVQAQSCAQSPSCESLGYNLTSTSECIGTALKCPFDNRYNCVTANDVINKMGPDYTRRKRLNRGIEIRLQLGVMRIRHLAVGFMLAEEQMQIQENLFPG